MGDEKLSAPRESVRLWTPEGEHPVEFLSARFVEHTFTKHAHAEYVIGVIDAGVESFHYRGAIHHAPAGTILLINPGEVHSGFAGVPEGWAYRMIYPPAELMSEIAADCGSGHTVPHFTGTPVLRDEDVFRALAALHQASSRSHDPLGHQERLVTTLGLLIDRYGGRGAVRSERRRNVSTVSRAREYIHAELTREVSLADLAAAAGVSSFHLIRSFKQAFGLTPHAYLTNARLQHAKRLLRAGSSIADAAYSSGFVDQSHFTHAFKRAYGLTPGRFVARR